MVNNAQSIAVSQILKFKSVGEGEPMKKSREDWRKAKELEEARKAGTAPAALDEKDKDINPHISHYITTAPWYYGTSEPTLKHQRPQDDKQTEYSHLAEWYSRGVDTTNIVTKYRKGVCQNCGAMIHKKKFCMERPRKVGAKFSGSNIAYDGGESLEAPPKSLLLAQTEDYTEYSRSRKFIKKQDKEVIKSKYEDVYINNHTSLWCSYWKGGQWGYKCCHSFVKNSYCLGEAGRSVSSVKLETIKVEENSSSDKSEETEKPDNGSSGGYVSSSSEDEKIEKKKQKERKNKRSEAKDKLKEVLKAEEESKARADKLLAMNERKRPYNSMFEVKKPTDEEMEAYYLKRRREEDPMSQFM